MIRIDKNNLEKGQKSSPNLSVVLIDYKEIAHAHLI